MFNSKNDLPAASRKRVSAILNQTLADLSDLYSQTKQAHWNVRGPSFYSLHKLFDDLAASVEAHLDDTAERITALGALAQGTVRQAAAASALPEFPDAQPGEFSYVAALVERYSAAAKSVRKAIDATDALGDADTADLLTGVSRDLDKALWMLEAHSRK
ncbi:MAG TPA: DNA starvation/stationary phase protection protein Dps [Opitutaceae bacterium]|nr:DNA starvation/stationary phase protection protein Dps [Opitutaceae bacterium]